MRYLITGATGFLGGEVVGQLLAEGHEVTALVRNQVQAKRLLERGVRLFQGDVTDPVSLPPAMEGQDGVFHLAAWYQVGVRLPQAVRINVEGTRHVIEEAWRAGVARILHCSSLAVNSDTRGELVDESYRFDGAHLSEYDRTKWMAHYQVAQPLAERGAPVVIVQPGVIYGPHDHSSVGAMFRSWLQGRQVPHCPDGAYCWGHVADTARGVIDALERGHPGESYMICGPAHSLGEAFEIGARIVGRPPPRPAIPAPVLRAGAKVLGPLANALPFLTGQVELLRVGPATYLGDASKARQHIGFQARPLEIGFGELLPGLLAGQET